MQQSSYYGFASMLPPKYTQAVMVGESKLKQFNHTNFLVHFLKKKSMLKK